MNKTMNSLDEVERMLSQLMLSNEWSKKQLKDKVRENRICLRDGKAYGNKLKSQLKGSRARVPVEEAKQYPLAKMCLLKCRT